MSEFRTYLGDAVYADVNRAGDIILTVEDGIRATASIVLEPQVYTQLLRWVKHVSDHMAQTRKPMLENES
jgi:hypothetical protein